MQDKNQPAPPRLASWLLQHFAPSARLEELQGDLLEMFSHWIKTEGLKVARQRYTWSVLRLLRPFSSKKSEDIQFHTRFNAGMISNNVKITRRGLVKNGKYALINLAGLTLGLTVCIFIFLFVSNELSYDQWLPGQDRVVRIQPTITTEGKDQTWATSEGFLIPMLTPRYPEIEAAARVLRFDHEMEFTFDSKRFSEYDFIAADSSLFKVFPFPFIYGDRNTALDRPDAAVISYKAARKFFGNVNPVGRVLRSGGDNFTITGVFRDIPSNSHLHFEMILPLHFFWGDADRSRDLMAFYSYLLLKSPQLIKPLSQKLLHDEKQIYGVQDKMETVPGPPGVQVKLNLVRVSSIHLNSKAEKEFGTNGSLQVVYIFIAIACLILSIVVINYINLSNAMALRRAREVAIRKTIGASRARLMLGFIIESYAFTAIAFAFSLGMVMLLMPGFNTLAGKQFDLRLLLSPQILGPMAVLWIALGFLAGFYPAMLFSSFKPIEILKSGNGVIQSGGISLSFRRGLLIFQFMISAFLIVCSVIVRRQMQFIETMDTGFNKNNVLVIPVKGDIQSKSAAFKNEVNKLPEVESSAFTSAIPGKRVVFLSVRVPDLAGTLSGQDSGMRDMRVMSVDQDFIKTLQIHVVKGRDFSRQNVSDITSSFVLNEAAVKELNLKDPVGKPFEYRFGTPKKGHIIGVVKDFNFASIHNRVEPLMLHILPWYSSLCIRLNTHDVNESVLHVNKIWNTFSSSPFEYSFLDATYDAQYRSEQTTSKLVTWLSILALAFACIGLFGVVSFYIRQRTREVGIRKVFGASGISLLHELSREYLIVVTAGNILALYPAWLLSSQWLQNFTYRVPISADAFLLAFGVSVLLAYGSIFRVILKILRTNPAVVLRNE